MAARTHAPYNASKDCLEISPVTLERSLQLCPSRDPTKFITMPMGLYDPISQEYFFEDRNEWVRVQELEKYAAAYEQIKQIDDSDISEGNDLSCNTVPNSLVREQNEQSLLTEEMQTTVDMQFEQSPTNVTVVQETQKDSDAFIEELLDMFVPMGSGVVELGSPSAPSAYSAQTEPVESVMTEPVESTLVVSLRAQRQTQVQPGAVKLPSDSDLEDTADSDAEFHDLC